MSRLDALLEEAWRIRKERFPDVIYFDYPLRTLSISVTGTRCALNCAHCGGRYLASMKPIWEALNCPDSVSSLLISGGCDKEGRVPVAAHLEEIKTLAPGRRLNWHVGFISEEEADAIAPYVDAVSFDFVGDDETIAEVYGLARTVQDYVETLRMLKGKFKVVPHITIGLRGGKLGHERKALEILAQEGIEGLVFIVFVPTPGTRYAVCHPPLPEEVAALIAEARALLPGVPIALGCMRPHGVYRERLDPLAVRAGVNRIVSPARTAWSEARRLGLRVERAEECCVFDL